MAEIETHFEWDLGLVDSVAMLPIPTRHRHFGCTSVAGFGCSVHLLGGGCAFLGDVCGLS